MNPRAKAWLRAFISISLLLLAVALASREDGGQALMQSLTRVDAAYLLACVAITIPMQIVSAWRWRYTCTRINVKLPFTTALAEYYLATLLNMLLPGGIVGDMTRVWRQQGAGKSSIARAIHGVVLERFAGQCALFAVLIMAIVFHHDRLPSLAVFLLLPLLTAVLIVIAWQALSRHARSREAFQQLRIDARHAFLPLAVFITQTGLSLIIIATYLLAFWFASCAVHAPLDISTTLLAVPLVLSAMTIPISVGGLGLREVSAAALWPLFSLPASDGAASALIYGFAMLVGALPGVLVASGSRQQ